MRSATLPCALALAATAVFAGSASASPTTSFGTSHYDRCLASSTSGELAWRPVVTAVAVSGYVTLRNPQQCVFPTRPVAVALFTAYNGRTVVDSHRESAPTGGASFQFVLTDQLSPTPAPRPIDRVTVQVCHTAPSTSADRLSCGDVVSYPVG